MRISDGGVVIRVRTGDALSTSCDVLALKYSQTLDGTDRAAVRLLESRYPTIRRELPAPGDFSGLYQSPRPNGPDYICFVGVTTPSNFLYRDIEEFGSRAMATLAGARPETTVLGVTLHGPGYGLDELASFDAQLAGMLSSLQSGDAPSRLREILFIEQDEGRAERLVQRLEHLDRDSENLEDDEVDASTQLDALSSPSRPTVFVAMPFHPKFDDVFTFGIQQALHEVGLKCERIDRESFVGDILAEIRRRISRSSLVVADLSWANANVYLEVGYAWASERPTILLFRPDTETGCMDLEFDTRGQRCIRYESITELSASIQAEVEALRRFGAFA